MLMTRLCVAQAHFDQNTWTYTEPYISAIKLTCHPRYRTGGDREGTWVIQQARQKVQEVSAREGHQGGSRGGREGAREGGLIQSKGGSQGLAE